MSLLDLALLIMLYWACYTLSECVLRSYAQKRQDKATASKAAEFSKMPVLDDDGPKVGPLPSREHKVETSFDDGRIGKL